MGALKNLSMDEITDPFDKGWVANSRVYGQDTNPYLPGSLEWEEWNDGWIAFRDYRPK